MGANKARRFFVPLRNPIGLDSRAPFKEQVKNIRNAIRTGVYSLAKRKILVCRNLRLNTIIADKEHENRTWG
jgi:hypothetical protein